MMVFIRIRKTLENKTNMEDDRISFLETQLAQARKIAEESDKKYEEVRKRHMVVVATSTVECSSDQPDECLPSGT